MNGFQSTMQEESLKWGLKQVNNKVTDFVKGSVANQQDSNYCKRCENKIQKQTLKKSYLQMVISLLRVG